MQINTALLALLTLPIVLTGCNNNDSARKQTPQKEQTVHKPKRKEVVDHHGCKTWEGYVWSEVKDSCIRLWESGTELQQKNDWEAVAVVVLANDGSRAELYFPDEPTIVLPRKSNTSWGNDSLLLTGNTENFSLAKNGIVQYRVPISAPEPAPPKKTASRKKRR